MFDLAIIGAGPIGTEAAIGAKRAGLSYVLLDKGAMVDAIYRWPTFLTFFTTSERLLDSTLQMIRTVPHLALLPLVILWFGIGEPARVFLIALGTFFPIYLNTFYGIRQVDGNLTEMGRAYGLSTWALLRPVILPGALPNILVGLRYALGIMWLTLVVAEMNAATSGIGFLTSTAREFMRTDVLTFAIVLYALLGKLADVIARALERRFLPWHPNYVKEPL